MKLNKVKNIAFETYLYNDSIPTIAQITVTNDQGLRTDVTSSEIVNQIQGTPDYDETPDITTVNSEKKTRNSYSGGADLDSDQNAPVPPESAKV